MSKLLSVSILFRHGARGPGDSETSAWEEHDPVVNQWEEHEMENLSTVGQQMLKDVGAWFARKYILSEDRLIPNPRPFFRMSKSDRAVDSGRDFVNAFNATLGYQCCPEVPAPFAESADCYFRPWKVHADSSKTIKLKMKSEDWQAKVNQHKDFLARVRAELAMKGEYGENLSKTLWSITHVAGLVECETYWPTPGRTALTSRVRPEDYGLVNELACWVWRQRFLESGFEYLLGGWIFLEMIMQTFDCYGDPSSPAYHNINFFSGHDYTILALLAIDHNLFPLDALKRPIEFGSYVIFELWESTPPPLPTLPACVTQREIDTTTSVVAPMAVCPPDSLHSHSSVTTAESLSLNVAREFEPQTPNTETSTNVTTPSPMGSQFSSSQQFALDNDRVIDKLTSSTSPTEHNATHHHHHSSQQAGETVFTFNNASSAAQTTTPGPTEESPRLRERVLRVILNQRVFERKSDVFGVDAPRSGGGATHTHVNVRDDRAVVLADLSMSQVHTLVHNVVAALRDTPTGLPAHFKMPQFE